MDDFCEAGLSASYLAASCKPTSFTDCYSYSAAYSRGDAVDLVSLRDSAPFLSLSISDWIFYASFVFRMLGSSTFVGRMLELAKSVSICGMALTFGIVMGLSAA